jgi:hypothetical protein
MTLRTDLPNDRPRREDPSTAPSQAEIDETTRAVQIALAMTKFWSHSDHDVEDMPNSIAQSCLATPLSPIESGLSASTDLFASQWFDKALDGSGLQLVHGTDIMFCLDPMFRELLKDGEIIEGVSFINFRGGITRNLDLFLVELSPEDATKDKKTISGTVFSSYGENHKVEARFTTSEGRTFALRGYDNEQALTHRAASNTFVNHLAAIPFAASKVDGLDSTTPIPLPQLKPEVREDYEELKSQNPLGILTTTILDIAIMRCMALGQQGHVRNQNPTGGGFTDISFHNPELITEGCDFTVTEIAEAETTRSGAQIFPVSFKISHNSGKTVATGTFNWIDKITA